MMESEWSFVEIFVTVSPTPRCCCGGGGASIFEVGMRFQALPWLFVSLASLQISLGELSVSYITTDVGYSCATVCQSYNLQCFDNLIQEMNCAKGAAEFCSSNDLTDLSGSYHCDKGGCYVDCDGEVYASRGTQYWTCNTQPICHLTSSSGDSFHTYQQVCPCAFVTEDGDSSVHLLLWQMIGIGLFLACCALGAVQLIAILFPNLFPSK
jgi:hypothetical protein